MPKISSYTTKAPALGDVLLGSDAGTSNETSNFTAEGLLTLFNNNTVPATSTDAGTKGQIAVNATHIYICISTDTWMRAAIATF